MRAAFRETNWEGFGLQIALTLGEIELRLIVFETLMDWVGIIRPSSAIRCCFLTTNGDVVIRKSDSQQS